MRKKLFVFFLFFGVFVLFVSIRAQAAPLDSEQWKAMDVYSKRCYLSGFRRGFLAALVKKPEEKSIQRIESYFYSGTLSSIEENLDVLYGDPANVKIPMIVAIHIAILKIQGAPEDAMQAIIASGRNSSEKIAEVEQGIELNQ